MLQVKYWWGRYDSFAIFVCFLSFLFTDLRMNVIWTHLLENEFCVVSQDTKDTFFPPYFYDPLQIYLVS